MNVLLVTRNFYRGGGASSRWNSLLKYLSEKHKIYVLTNVPQKIAKDDISKPNIRTFHCPMSPRFSHIPFLSAVNIISLIFYIYRSLLRVKPDAILVTIPELEEGIACTVASRSFRGSLIVEVRDLIVEDHVEAVYSMLPKLFRKFLKFVFEKAFLWVTNSSDRVVTVTSTLKEYLVSKGTNVPISVIPNGADTEIFVSAGPGEKLNLKRKIGFENEFLILYAGAMNVVYYPMHVVFRAVKIVSQSSPDIRLVLCGTAGKNSRASMESLGDNVKYLGQVDRERTAELMRTCDLGVITMDERMSTFCALTTKFFEYLASGMPVVASCPKGGELDRLITKQQVGYAVPSGDYEAMAERIVRLIKDNSKRQIFAENGIDLIASKFTRKKQAETYNRVLLEIEKAKK